MFEVAVDQNLYENAVIAALRPVHRINAMLVADRLEPPLNALVPEEATGRLFRLDNRQRDLILAGLYRALYNIEMDAPSYGFVNRAALDIGIWLENSVSEHWRLQAGGKPRD